MALMLVIHNIPLAVTDHLGRLIKESFKDSATAQGFTCARTETSCIIHKAVTPHFKNTLT